MTRSLRKTLFRDIRQSFARFIAIFAITALGACFFAGLRATGPDMKRTADQYFADSNLMDYRLLSTMGFTADDVQALRELPGISAVMPAQRVDLLVRAGEQDIAARFHSLPDASGGKALNTLRIVEGRLPENPGECVVGGSMFWRDSFAGIGETITVSDSNTGSSLDLLKRRSFTVVGVAESPLYLSNMLGASSVGGGTLTAFVFVPQEDFDNTYYTELFAMDADTTGLSAFSDAYAQTIDAGVGKLGDFGAARAQARYDGIHADAQRQIDDAQTAYDTAKADAEAKLADARQKLLDAQAEIDQKRTDLESAKQQLADGAAQLASTKRQLDASRAQLNASQAQYDAGLQAYQDNLSAYTAQREAWDAAYAALDPNDPAYESTLAYLQTQLPALDAMNAQLEQAKAQLDASKAQLDAGWAQYNSGRAKYNAGLGAYNAASAKLQDSAAQIRDGEQALSDAEQQLADGQAAFDSQKAGADAKLADAAQKIEDGKQALNDLKAPRWYVFSRENNPGYAGFGSDADRIGAIASIIPIFFFLVAALVCLTTMTRMVEEQRTQIGMLKAQGFSKFGVALKYICYAGAASLLGAVFGIFAGVTVFPSTIWHAYQILYQMPGIELGGNTLLITVTLLIAVLVTTLSAFAACYGALSNLPAELMRPKAPQKGKRVILERIPLLWRRLKFSQKVAGRNLLLSKKRFFMTIIGVLGCTALLLAGFGLRDAINGIASYQFGVIQRYDAAVSLTGAGSAQDANSFNSLLHGKADALYVQEIPVTAQSDSVSYTDLSIQLYIPEDPQKLPDFFRLAERASQKPIPFPEGDGVVLTEKLARTLQVGVGDTVTVRTTETDGSDVSAVLTISGIAENYVYHLIFLSPETYEKAFGRTPGYDMALLRLSPDAAADRETFLAQVVADKNVAGLLDLRVLENNVSDMLRSMNAVVWLIIISAASLAFVVLFNLININITEREREIATLKVLGFYDAEIRRTVFRENRILTFIGIALGLVAGVFLTRYITTGAEVDEVMFRRVIEPLSFALAVAFTALCAEVVNFVMRRRLREIDMVGSLKSAE